MSAKTPVVAQGWLYDPRQPAGRIRLDTPAWLAWLEDAATTSFAYPLADPTRGYITGFMTVRKERRQRGGQYWTVYHRCGRRVRKVYVGRSTIVTETRLQAIAGAFLMEECPRHREEVPIAPSY